MVWRCFREFCKHCGRQGEHHGRRSVLYEGHNAAISVPRQMQRWTAPAANVNVNQEWRDMRRSIIALNVKLACTPLYPTFSQIFRSHSRQGPD
jgi:hypothetical protein